MLGKNEHYVVYVKGEFLVALPYVGSARFSNSAYDGYPFDDFIVAQRYAKFFGGQVMIHNRLNGNLAGGWA